MGNLAAVDCGTLSTRLLISTPTGCPVLRLMRITRLGEGVDRSGLLLPDAIERTLAVLREYQGLMAEHEVQTADGGDLSAAGCEQPGSFFHAGG